MCSLDYQSRNKNNTILTKKQYFMKIFNAEQIKKCDRVTCERQNIQFKDLISRAATAFVETLLGMDIDISGKILVFCGHGNNGADGIAIAKLLYSRYCEVELVLLPTQDIKQHNESFQFYLDNPTDSQPFPVHILKKITQLHDLADANLVIDAILGISVNRPLEGILSQTISWINESQIKVVSVDIPTGIGADSVIGGPCIKADFTITFAYPKFSFFLPQSAKMIGKWIVADIDCDKDFIDNEPVKYYWIDSILIHELLKQRDRFAHKGIFGHSFIVSGSYGKVGSTILCGKAALRIGSGLVTFHSPACAYEILQMAAPEAMVEVDKHKYFISEVSIPDKCNAIAIGPGIGTKHHTQRMLDELFHTEIEIPMVLDADALNLLSLHPEIFVNIPKGTILTPHVKEFERLFGSTTDYSSLLELQRQKAIDLEIFIVLKGGFTTICSPDGETYFNTNGNPGMATGGSGDVLTGMIVGLLAQGYSRKEACILGVYLHGMSGDMAVLNGQSYESLIASDLIDNLGKTFKKITGK